MKKKLMLTHALTMIFFEAWKLFVVGEWSKPNIYCLARKIFWKCVTAACWDISYIFQNGLNFWKKWPKWQNNYTSQFNFLFQKGIRGFWKGVTASYWGISETVIHFVIYEYLKKQLAIAQNKRKTDDKTILDFVGFMACGACSKTCATIVAYPHGKAYLLFFGDFFDYYCILFWGV